MYEQQYDPYRSNVLVVKRYFGSGKVLALGILYLVSALINMVVILTESMNTNSYVYLLMDLFDEMKVDIPSELSDMLAAGNIGYRIGAIVGSVLVPILMAVAFILIFAKSRSASPSSTPMAGLTILFIFSVIYFVSVIVSVVALCLVYLLLFLAIMGLADYNNSPELGRYGAIGMVVVGVILAIGCFISIFYAASYKNFYRSARRSLRSVNLENRGATAYGVFCIIMAVIQFFSFLSNVVLGDLLDSRASYYIPTYDNVWSAVLTSVIQIVILIFTAIVAIGYGSYINNQKYSYNTSPYGGYDNGGYTPVYHNPASPYGDPYSDNDRPNGY